MMERKLWFKIFALQLLALSALASQDNETLNSVAPDSTAGPGLALALGTTTADPESRSSLGESGQVSVPNNNTQTSPNGSGLNSTTEEESPTLIKPATSNGTTPSNATETPDTNGNTKHAPPSVAPENQTSTTQSQPTTAPKAPGPSNKTDTPPAPLPTSPSHPEITNTTQSDAPIHIENVTLITKPTPSTSATAASTASMTTSAASTITTTTTLVQGSTQAPAGEDKPTPTHSEVPDKLTTTHSQVPDKHTTTHSEVPGDAVSHKTITPSQLNVGEETTVVHEGATLDPLLAGLVSAFIIAAVIITLLLFLKLRRRDSRPEFRRLQDLPMDDMMEDAPLSMYSY
uniref:Uncharacterized protein n=1 Tax=Neogobius melanostomus TaxID=47308 RepID=A0A8C6SYV1_9GOBI